MSLLHEVAAASIVLALTAAGGASGAQAAQEPRRDKPFKATRLPEPIAALQKALEGKTPDDALRIAIERFGAPTRDTGSGLQIPQWDVAGGVLTVHPLTGPTFFSESLKLVRLIRTHNPLGRNLVGSWEVTTLPDPDNHGTSNWIGVIELRADGAYSYRPADELMPQNRPAFFAGHPTGIYVVKLQPPLAPDSLLEELEADLVVAAVEFSAAPERGKPAAKVSVRIRARTSSRDLAFEAEQPLGYRSTKSWSEFWR